MQWRLYKSTSLTTKGWQCWGSAGYCKVPKLLFARPAPVFTCHFRPLGQDQHQRICSRLGSGSGFCFGLRFADAKGECGSQGQPACTIHTPSCSNGSAFKHATPATLQLASKEHIILDTLLSHAAKPWKQPKYRQRTTTFHHQQQ